MVWKRYLIGSVSLVSLCSIIDSRARAADSHVTTAGQVENPKAAVVQQGQARRTTLAHGKGASGGEDEQIIVTGTRDPHQTARHSMSPVTIVSGAQLRATGQSDLRDALTLIAPSITRPDMAGGNANLVDALSLRSLSADQTLVLVNGKRRHTTAIVADYMGPQTGTTPVDVDMIPLSSIDHVEVLQDGAAALYGSDAIAGVINIILKTSSSGITAQAINGGYEEGDGFTTGETLNMGFKLGKKGFFNLGMEVKHQAHTVRVGIDDRVGTYANKFVGNPNSTRETISYNAGYDITPRIQLYSFATYGHRYGQSFQNYRTPSVLPQVYPEGFSPQITLNSNDFQVAAGIKGHDFWGWGWDLSTTYGAEYDNIGMISSANVDLYNDTHSTPQNFHMMSFSDSQWTSGLDVHRSFAVPVLAGPVNFAMGAQYRYETYNVGAGEPASYYGAGAESEDGLSQLSVAHAGRDVTAGYVDASTYLLKNWQIDFAGRVEHYTDSGNTETGKVSTRYDFNKYFALRGAISNGFRAPNLAEQHYTSLGVLPTGAQGILAVNTVAAQMLGSKALKPERSTNFSAGFLLNPVKNLHISVDAYQIAIKNRIVLGGNYNGATAENALKAQGIQLSDNVIPADVSAQYFSNAANTRTRGVDITAQYRTNVGRYGYITWDASFNMQNTDVTHVNSDENGNLLLNRQGMAYLSTYFPKNKLIFGGHWYNGRFDLAIHELRYGSTTSQLQYTSGPLAYSNTQFLEFVNTPKFATNIQIGYKVTPQLRLALGANNIFNKYPREIPTDTRYLGVYKYDYTSEQIGVNGGFYYMQANLAM